MDVRGWTWSLALTLQWGVRIMNVDVYVIIIIFWLKQEAKQLVSAKAKASVILQGYEYQIRTTPPTPRMERQRLHRNLCILCIC